MARWTCSRCDREFGRANQSHTCIPGGTVDDSFRGRPQVQREIYDAIAAYLATIGPVHADAVQVGVFLKRERKFAEVRPMARALSLDLVLPRLVDDPRIVRTIRATDRRYVHVLRLSRVADVDEQVRAWLAESYLDAVD
ncbi:MAG: hypothetical protein JOZ99_08995 [Actinobacteria bacterium]|nr:hypothetical protein [Actinomycetota bacterium]